MIPPFFFATFMKVKLRKRAILYSQDEEKKNETNILIITDDLQPFGDCNSSKLKS